MSTIEVYAPQARCEDCGKIATRVVLEAKQINGQLASTRTAPPEGWIVQKDSAPLGRHLHYCEACKEAAESP